LPGAPIDPAVVGIVGTRGPADKQAFMVAFFKSRPPGSSRSKRSMEGEDVDKNSKTQHHRQDAIFSDEPVHQSMSYPMSYPSRIQSKIV